MDQELLQAIKVIVNEAITASEERTQAAIAASEERTQAAIAASENRMRAYFENDLKKSVDLLADGHKLLTEKIERMDVRKDLDEIKGSLAVIESAVTRNTSSIIELQKAQG